MAEVSGIKGNNLQPRQQRRARKSKEDVDSSQGVVDVGRQTPNPDRQKDTVELSAEAQELLRQSRERSRDG